MTIWQNEENSLLETANMIEQGHILTTAEESSCSLGSIMFAVSNKEFSSFCHMVIG
jgi:hypothetical protein